MSATVDSTRDWLLKKLLKASRSLAEQQEEITQLKLQVSLTQDDLDKMHSRHRDAIKVQGNLANRVNDLQDEITQLKRVPPVAPNLTVVENPSHKRMDVLSVSSTKGATTITVARARSES